MTQTAFNDLVEQLQNGKMFELCYKKDGKNVRKFFTKGPIDDFFDTNEKQLRIFSYAEKKLEAMKADDIDSHVEYHDEETKTPYVEYAEKQKRDFEKFKPISSKFVDFDLLFFDSETDNDEIKMSCYLGLSSTDCLSDESPEMLDNLKNFWKEQISLHKQTVLKYVEEELQNNINENQNNIANMDDFFDQESIDEIKLLVSSYDPTEELNQITTNKQLFEYWPTLLLPAPDFISEIFAHTFQADFEPLTNDVEQQNNEAQ